MPVCSANASVSRSSAATRPKSSSTAGRSSTARRRTSWSALTTSSRSSARAARARVVRERLLERLQPEQDRGQRLPGLVVELAREPPALQLLRLHDAAERIARDALRQLDGDGGAGRERLGQPQVVVGEARVAALPCRGSRARRSPGRARSAAPTCRCARRSAASTSWCTSGSSITESMRSLRRRSRTAPLFEPRARDRLAEQLLRALPGRREPQVVVAARQRDRDDTRSDQLAQAAHDEVEQALEIGLGGERVADLVQRLRAGATSGSTPRRGARSRSRPRPGRRGA